MCGISGYSLAPGTRRIDAVKLARACLLGIEERGRDASGAAWANRRDGQIWYAKGALPASKFVDAYELDVQEARALIAHTRYATNGTPKDNANNHPFDVGGVVGVHNGVIINDYELFDYVDRDPKSECDSEAAFAMLAYSNEHPADVLPFIEGSAALAWLNANDAPGTLHLARVASSPLWVAQTARGSVLFGSTKSTLLKAAMAGGFRVRYINDIPEGAYLRIEQGKWVEVKRFDVPKHKRPAGRYYNCPSKYEKRTAKPKGKRVTRVTPAHGWDDGDYWYGSAEEAAAAFVEGAR